MCPPVIAALPVAIGGAGSAAAASAAAAAGTTTAAAVTAAWSTLGTAATIGSAGLGMASAYQGAKAQADMAEQNAENANEGLKDQHRLINLKEAEEQEKYASEKIARDLEAQKVASRVKATDSGGFLNNDAITQDIMRQGLVADTMASQNLERASAQYGEQRKSATTSAQSRINQVAPPSSLATGLQIASHGLQGVTAYSDRA